MNSITVKQIRSELIKALQRLEGVDDTLKVLFTHDDNGSVIYNQKPVINYWTIEVVEMYGKQKDFVEIAVTMNSNK